MSEKRLYIAYGSNLNLPQMAHRCPTAKVEGITVLKDHELLFRGNSHSGVATVEPRPGCSVPVMVWSIKPRDEKALDLYEGYPTLYGKHMTQVELAGRKLDAMVYTMTEGHLPAFPSAHYLGVIAEGYASAGFDPAVLDRALERTRQAMQVEGQAVFEPRQPALYDFVPADEPEDMEHESLLDSLSDEELRYMQDILASYTDELGPFEDEAADFVMEALLGFEGDMADVATEHISYLLELHGKHQDGELAAGEALEQAQAYLTEQAAPTQGQAGMVVM